MQWGIHLAVLAYPQVQLKTAFELLREEGVRYVELGHSFFLEKIISRPEWFKETLASYEIEPIQMHAPGLNLSKFDEPRKAVKEVIETAELATWLEVGSLIVHTGMFDLSWENLSTHVSKVRRANIEFFKEIANKAEDLGLIIAVENRLERAYGSTPTDLLNLLEEVGSNSLGICLDTGHANVNEFPAHEFLMRIRERLVATHIHDNDGQFDRHLPPLMGNIDWETFLSILRESGYSKPLIYEIASARSVNQAKNKLRLLSYISEKLL